MRMFFTGVAQFFATIFAILFVITTLLALFLSTIDQKLFNANLYKNALNDQRIYENLPQIVSGLLTTSTSFNPCTENPLVCEDISPELKACYEIAFGNKRFTVLATGQEQPTGVEKQAAQSCLDQYGSTTTGTFGKPSDQSGSSGSNNQGGMPPFMQNLKSSDWETIFKTITTPEDLQIMTESMLDQIFAYLNGETETVKLSLIALKGRLSGQAGLDVVNQLLQAQPPCTPDQIVQMVNSVNSKAGIQVLCNPGNDLLDIGQSLVLEQLNTAVAKIPDEAVIIKPALTGSLPPGSGPFGSDPISTIRMVRLILRMSPLLPLASLILVTIFGVRSLKGWMRWWGIPIFIAGVIALVLMLTALPVINWAWINYVAPRIPPYIPTDIAGIGQNIIRFIIHALTGYIMLQAIILTVVGLALWIGSIFIKRKEKPHTAPPLAPESGEISASV